MKGLWVLIVFATNLLPISTNLVFADWHSWSEEPQEGQLYMYVELQPCKPISERQTLHISHYHKNDRRYQNIDNGWWDVTKETIWDWLHQGSQLLYSP